MQKEGSLAAPTRHAIAWRNEDFYNQGLLLEEMERVFDICHTCRRCVNLCQTFPTLFDLVDQSETMELDSVAKDDYEKVVAECYLCDLCYMTKCPYVPPHEWMVDFPQLMLRAKAVKFKQKNASISDKLLSSSQLIGKVVSRLKLASLVNKINDIGFVRKLLNIHPKAFIFNFQNKTASKLFTSDKKSQNPHKVAIFTTCYGEYNEPQIVGDLIAVLRHNKVDVELLSAPKCCGMPKLELGDIQSVVNYAKQNKAPLLEAANQGYKLMAPIPSCVFMFKDELPLLLNNDKEIQKIANAFVDPFEYLDSLNKNGQLNIEFSNGQIEVLYHAACHQRVQNIGAKTQKILNLIPDIKLKSASRCSGHDGTYGVKKSSYEFALKIGKPITKQINKTTNYIVSDCVIAGNHLAHISDSNDVKALHPISLIRKKYGI